MINLAALNNLVEGIKRIDNRLTDALRMIVKAISHIPDIDSGKNYCDASQTDGTNIKLNAKFNKITGVSVMPIGSVAIFPVVNVYATTNITYITVLLFDSVGNRVSGDVYWIVYGISG